MKRLYFVLGFVLGLASTSSAQVLRVAELNTEQIRGLDRQRTVVILPGGILEEHGPYLPSYSDGYYNERLARDLAEAVAGRPGWTAVVFPTIPLGSCGANEIGGKYWFPGSYTVRMATLRAVFIAGEIVKDPAVAKVVADSLAHDAEQEAKQQQWLQARARRP